MIDKIPKGLVLGNEVSVVYFLTSHQATITNGRLHDINVDTEFPYIVVMAHDTSTHRIDLEDIRTLQKK